MDIFRKTWETFLEDNYLPCFMRSVRELDYSEFEKTVRSGDTSVVEQLIRDTLHGDVFVLKNVMSREDATNIKETIYRKGKETEASEFIPEDSTIPNYHTKSFAGNYVGGYDEVTHAHYFYRWNEDDLGVLKILEDSWDTIKIFNGLGQDGLKDNTPEDKIIDRVQVLHYPINSGEITTHCDAARWQITNFGVNLTEKGTDFEDGGFYCVDRDGKEVDLESRVKTGDGIFWSPSVFHGVKTPTGFGDVDWEKSGGRWQMITQAIQSRLVDNRRSSVSYEAFLQDPNKVKESYLFRDMQNS